MRFEFGENWLSFAERALTTERVRQAEADLEELLAGIGIEGRTFLDIGFGQGLTLLAAKRRGARVVGLDVDPRCVDALAATRGRYPDLDGEDIPVVVGSILDDRTVAGLAARVAADGGYDMVHAWGVLHHTGDMASALARAASLVRPGGHLVVALYNRHWTSPIWKGIKAAYVRSPRLARRLLVGALYPAIFAAKWLVTRADPRRQARGMDFHHNVVDWVGGYPYEYATVEAVTRLAARHGLARVRFRRAEVPTGCNEFVFAKGAPAPGTAAASTGRKGGSRWEP
ncbi:MAG: class I SAM-dependent methyltransferase [Planctomycetes bacterium]|nr:class I SAM-dependent methyltransferase [Planctomycetota bacterium]